MRAASQKRLHSQLQAGPCIRPAPEDNPRHRDLEAWMAAYGHQIVSGE